MAEERRQLEDPVWYNPAEDRFYERIEEQLFYQAQLGLGIEADEPLRVGESHEALRFVAYWHAPCIDSNRLDSCSHAPLASHRTRLTLAHHTSHTTPHRHALISTLILSR